MGVGLDTPKGYELRARIPSDEETTMSTTTDITVTGMTCGHCVAAVTEELLKLDGVSDVAIDLDSGSVVITSSAPLDAGQLTAAVDEAGYEVAS